MCWTGPLTTHSVLLVSSLVAMASPFLHRHDRALRLMHVDRHERQLQQQHGPQSYTPPHVPYMTSSQRPRENVRTLMGSGHSCHVDPVKMTIQPPRRYAHVCAPTTQISFGCRGGCSSYSRVSLNNSTAVHSSCSCCSPTGFGFHVVKMPCEGFYLRATVKFALGCLCRPCLASVRPMDIQRLRDLLRSTSIANSG